MGMESAKKMFWRIRCYAPYFSDVDDHGLVGSHKYMVRSTLVGGKMVIGPIQNLGIHTNKDL